jgi:hypothetical protein
MYVIFTYVQHFFCYGFPVKGMGANNRFRERSRGVIKDPAVSLKRGIGSRGFNDPVQKCPSGSRGLIDTS